MHTATAAIVREPQGEISLENVELDDLQQGEILVRVEACGICHTDVKYQGVVPPRGSIASDLKSLIEKNRSP